jgi:Sulfotransferase family
VVLPTFLVVGAAKSGTTSLHRYLAAHPEIAMSSEKEPMCFEPPNWEERLAEYGALFEEDADVRGESSTAYSAYPWAPDVPDRVRSVIPDARIVYCVRDPIPRMLSHYAQNVWDKLPVRPFDELMDDLEHPMNMPVWCSRFATQYERWAERFGPERILVLDQRDLDGDRVGTLTRVFEFLGVDPLFRSEAWNERHNTAEEHGIPKPTLSRRQRRRVRALLEPEARRLHDLTGIAIDHWHL